MKATMFFIYMLLFFHKRLSHIAGCSLRNSFPMLLWAQVSCRKKKSCCKYSKLCQQLKEGNKASGLSNFRQLCCKLPGITAQLPNRRLWWDEKDNYFLWGAASPSFPAFPGPSAHHLDMFVAPLQQDQVGLVTLAAVVVVILQAEQTGPSSGPTVGGMLPWTGATWLKVSRQTAMACLNVIVSRFITSASKLQAPFIGLIYPMDGCHWSKWSGEHSVCSTRHCIELVILGAISNLSPPEIYPAQVLLDEESMQVRQRIFKRMCEGVSVWSNLTCALMNVLKSPRGQDVSSHLNLVFCH